MARDSIVREDLGNVPAGSAEIEQVLWSQYPPDEDEDLIGELCETEHDESRFAETPSPTLPSINV